MSKDGRAWRIAPYDQHRGGPLRVVPFELKPDKDRGGYLRVSIVSDVTGKRRWHRISRLMLLTFVGPPPDAVRKYAAHWNGAHTDNAIENLRWVSAKENADDKRRHGTILFGEAHGSAKLSASQVRTVKKLIAAKVALGTIAKRFKVTYGCIYGIKHGLSRARG